MDRMPAAGLVRYGTQRLKKAGVMSPRLDCELILAYILGKDRQFLYMHPGYAVEPRDRGRFFKLLEERISGMPVQYITGCQEFMGLDFHVDKSVLIPRPDTEVLVEAVIGWLKDRREGYVPVAADIGTGSGAIAVSLAYYCPGIRVVAADISREALEVARMNAVRNGVKARIEFVEGDLLSPLEKLHMHRGIDVIVSNPPYIPSGEMAYLQKEVRREPPAALDGGRDGLDFYRRLVSGASLFLREGGLLALEIGYNQAEDVCSMLRDEKCFAGIKVLKDLGRMDRVVLATAI